MNLLEVIHYIDTKIKNDPNDHILWNKIEYDDPQVKDFVFGILDASMGLSDMHVLGMLKILRDTIYFGR